MVVSGQLHTPSDLPPERGIGTHWMGGWVGLRAGLDAAVVKSKDPALSENRTPVVQLVGKKTFSLWLPKYRTMKTYPVFN
jgi:hypothetical protein